MFQNAVQTLPLGEVTLFHVEHPPVEEASPADGTFLDQLMNAGVDHLNRKRKGKLAQGLSRSTSDPGTQASVVIFDTDSREPRVIGYRSDNAQALCTVPDRSLEARRPERTAASQQKNSLEQSGLARSVGTGNQGQPEIQLELGSFDTAEIVDLKGLKAQRPSIKAASA